LRLLSGWAQANLRLFPVLIGPAHGPQHEGVYSAR
jgi:hypothetical protein